MLEGKRSQITIFIIVGIIILFSTALVFYIKGQIVGAEIPTFSPITEEVPVEFQPIQTYVTDCITQVGTRAIQNIGAQGGWVSLDNMTLNGGEMFVDFDIAPTRSELVSVLGSKVPYWWYMKSDNLCESNCEFASKRPEMYSGERDGAKRAPNDQSIEAQIDRYVNLNLRRCLNKFERFTQQGFDIKEGTGELITTTTIADQDVVISLYYPLDMAKGDSKKQTSRYFSRINVNLRDIYNLAEEITNAEIKGNFTEYHTLQLIAIHSGRNKDIPPMSGGISFNPADLNYWIEPQVKETIERDILPTYVQALKLYDTRGFELYLADCTGISNMQCAVQQGLLNSFVLNLDLTKYYNYYTDFFYLSSMPSYLHITPRNGAVIMPSLVTSDMTFIQMSMRDFRFLYDISYPVVVRLEDPEAFDNDGFVFTFALETNIRNNRPFGPDKTLLSVPKVGISLFGNPENWVSGNITIEAQDAEDGKPLPGVIVSYSCAGARAAIGQTILNQDNTSARLVSPFPLCTGGLLSLYKPGYLGYSVPLDTYANETAFIVARAPAP